MANTMFFASFKYAHGEEQANLYFDYQSYFEDTFSPVCEIIQIIGFKVKGKSYAERKKNLRNIAIEFSHNEICGLSYRELYFIHQFFEIMGKRYGLLREFKENGICWWNIEELF